MYDSTPTLISSSTYAYDGFGRRVKKDVDGVVIYYIYDKEDIRFETDSIGTITAEYTHGHGIDEPLAMRRNSQNYYYHVNGLGTVTALTDSSKTVVQSYVYDSFGQIISQTGSLENPYTYTAREYDEETGLYYYRTTYYDANVGRFISENHIGLVRRPIEPPRFEKPLVCEDDCSETNRRVFTVVTGERTIIFNPWGSVACTHYTGYATQVKLQQEKLSTFVELTCECIDCDITYEYFIYREVSSYWKNIHMWMRTVRFIICEIVWAGKWEKIF